MCGITGIIDLEKTLSPTDRQAKVTAMNQAIQHRGPDEAGSFSDHTATLAMRRLSIIDQAGGQQPIFNETKDICVVFNGEIYNYQILKAQLQKKGHQFKTNSDTEVLVHLYEDYGTDMLMMIKGMFSFCIYDLNTKKWLIARDRFGEKPLFYHWNKKTFSFSSEVKSLLENTNIDRRLNHQALPYYFRTSLVPEPMTLLKDIYSLQPGHFILIDENGGAPKAYFKPNYHTNPDLKSVEEGVAYIQPFLENAIQRQTVSDVPIGAFLSGGIDSSTVVALLQKNSSQKIKTFNVKFENQDYDESAIAKKVAQHCGTDHHEVFIPDFDFDENIFWKIIDHVGLPFRDSSAIPSFLISQEISKYVKVALSGDGGDELFGGYQLFQWYQKILQLKKVNRPIRNVVNAGLGFAQTMPGLDQVSLVRKLKRGLNTSFEALGDIPIALNEMFSEEAIDQLLNNTEKENFPLLKDYLVESKDWSPLRKIMYYRLRYTLPTNMLVKVDRMSMASSLEVRAPFLDPDLFDASLRLPDNLLINKGQGKYLLRKIMEKELPKEVFNHPKSGFNIPLFKYQNERFKNLAKALLFENNPWPGFFQKEDLLDIFRKGISTKKDNSKQSVFRSAHQLWMMMQLLGWAKRFKVQL